MSWGWASTRLLLPHGAMYPKENSGAFTILQQSDKKLTFALHLPPFFFISPLPPLLSFYSKSTLVLPSQSSHFFGLKPSRKQPNSSSITPALPDSFFSLKHHCPESHLKNPSKASYNQNGINVRFWNWDLIYTDVDHSSFPCHLKAPSNTQFGWKILEEYQILESELKSDLVSPGTIKWKRSFSSLVWFNKYI